MNWKEIFFSQDWVLWSAALLLTGISLSMLFASADSSVVLSSRFGRQVIALVIGACLALFLSYIPYLVFKRWSIFFYAFSLLALLGVAVAGRVIRGTVSRLEFFGFQLQPSEIAKVALIISVAWLLSRVERISWRVLLSGLFLAGLPIAMILLEPDAGMAALLTMVVAGMFFFSGLSLRATGALVAIGLVFAAIGWTTFLADYQKARLTVWLDPANDPRGAGYNVLQSMVAFGSGQVTGRGLGRGPQSQLAFLPERHTDFIFASIGEELGFVGILLVLFLYVVIMWRVWLISFNTTDAFGQGVAVGVFLVLLFSVLIGAGMNMGMLPVTGLPMPLLSYGGSDLVTTFVLLGIVQSVRVNNKWVQQRPVELVHF